ncbi:hypothetical protein LZK73_11920 [Neorhizobium galegae]|nr:hypothetical protein LZK73_11920 [Neorhizobium galegae]
MSRLLLSALLTLMPCVCLAADQISLPKPFGDKAITRVHDLIPTMPDELDKYLSHIEEYGYDFGDVSPGCPAPVYCTGLPESESYATVRRFTKLSLADFISEIRKELDKHEFSGCSWLRFPNLRVMYQAPTKVTYVADISATKRACADTPFGEVKTDLASASGTVTVSVELLLTAPTLESEFSPGAFRVRVNDPIVNISKRTLLGFINADSLVGKIVQEVSSLVDFWSRLTPSPWLTSKSMS